MAVKYLDVNKNIINAIFLLDGDEDKVREGLNDILEDKGKVTKAVKKATTKKEKEDITEEDIKIKAEPTRRVRRSLFKNKTLNNGNF
ncbi:hypothetical protein V6O07_02455 [Arthrospira platensis SPKY2]